MAQTAAQSIGSGLSGLTFRNNLNTNLAALFSSNSGTAAPSPTVAGQLWLDTDAVPPTLYVRNNANTAWVELWRETLAANTVRANLTGAAAPETSHTMAELVTALGFSQVTGSARRFLMPSIGGSQMRILGGTGSTTVSGVTVTFPLAFSVAPTFVTGANVAANGTIVFQSLSASSVFVQGLNPSTGAAINAGFYWLAFGE